MTRAMLVVALAAGVAATCGAALARTPGRGIRVSYLERSLTIGGGSTATFQRRCPRAEPHPVGAEFGTLKGAKPGALALAASIPRGRRSWLIAVRNLTSSPEGSFVGIVCVGAKARFAYPQSSFTISAQHVHFEAVKCPASAPHAINGYFSPNSPGDLGAGILADGGPLLGVRGAAVDVSNLGSKPLGGFGGAICTTLRTGGFGIDGTVAAGKDDGYQPACPRRTPVAVGGFSLTKNDADRGAIVTDGSDHVSRGRWDTGVKSWTDHAVPYTAGVACIG